jgi:hypothetical protein
MNKRFWITILGILFFVITAYSQDAGVGGSPLRGLAVLRDGARKRISSYDRTGGNRDAVPIPPGKSFVLADIQGAGMITHIWVTISSPDPNHLRNLLLRMYWDGETSPSVESPIGDFFGIGYASPNYWSSAPLAVADRALNCFFPMPFSKSARIEAVNENEKLEVRSFYYYVDYESYADARSVEKMGRFHAQWRRMNPTPKATDTKINNTGKDNYVIMEATGRGHYVGVVMNIQGLATGWWGEGDDMIFIDGDTWPPTLHGTGLEDYFGGAWNFNNLNREYLTPYLGYSRKGNNDYTGAHTMYRFHIEDPVMFSKSIRVTIEHGHANDRVDDYSSVAYWYQTEPHKPFDPILPPPQRAPIRNWTAAPK